MAEPAQQYARTTERASHGVRSSNPILPRFFIRGPN
jgi:hypothetical protein